MYVSIYKIAHSEGAGKRGNQKSVWLSLGCPLGTHVAIQNRSLRVHKSAPLMGEVRVGKKNVVVISI